MELDKIRKAREQKSLTGGNNSLVVSKRRDSIAELKSSIVTKKETLEEKLAVRSARVISQVSDIIKSNRTEIVGIFDCSTSVEGTEKVTANSYYEMLEKTLIHKLYEHKLGWINDRQLVYTSSDCISYIQIKLVDNKIYWFVSQRSCDIEKHKLNDILFFKYLSNKLYPGTNFEIHYNCVFPHKYIKID